MNAGTSIDAETLQTRAKPRASGIRLSWIAALLLGWIAADNILLYGFLGFNLTGAIVGAVAVAGAVAFLVVRASATDEPRVSGATLLVCLGLALGLLILGGEGRFLYANADWQIRDALLADMGNNSWPFATQINGVERVLRAPLGMYLKPALIGGASQDLRDMALLGCNAILLTGILALGSALFETAKASITAIAVFTLFSGMDIVGTVITLMSGRWTPLDHVELWIPQSQFSSHVTMIFWVPQHAMAGWLCAVLLLLWRRGHVPVGMFAAAIPLMAIWSPLAIMGAVPFAIFAGIETLVQRKLRLNDVVLGCVALAVAAGPLLYLRAGSEAVASRLTGMTPSQYALVMVLEVIPFSSLVLINWGKAGFGRTIPVLATACLFLMPLYCIGEGIDFQMRASIIPLAILALGIGTLFDEAPHPPVMARIAAILFLFVGAYTPAMEIRRAMVTAPSPVPGCTLIDAWHRQSGTVKPTYAVYYAPLAALPAVMQQRPASRITPTSKAACWDRPWESPRR